MSKERKRESKLARAKRNLGKRIYGPGGIKRKKFIGPLPRPKFIGPLRRPKKFKARPGVKGGLLAKYMEQHSSLPSMMQTDYQVGAPNFNQGKGIVVKHIEYLQPILSVTAFSGAGRYIVQPGLVDNFPWLGQIAGSFENYLFQDVKYVYRNRLGTSAGVSVYTATQYDVSDPEFASVEELMTYAGGRSVPGYRDFKVDCNLQRGRMLKKYLVRVDDLPSGQDPQTYDQGLFTISAVSTSATVGTYCGDLLVEYVVKLWNPKMNPNLSIPAGLYSNMTSADATAYSAGPFATYVAGKESKYPVNSEPQVAVTGVDPLITMPEPGTYDISYHVNNTGSTFTIAGANIQLVSPAGGAIINSVFSGMAANANGLTLFCKVATLVANCVLQLNVGTVAGTSGGVINSVLSIVPEAATFVLEYLGSGPVQIDEPTFHNLVKRYPLSPCIEKFRKKLQMSKDIAYIDKVMQRRLFLDRKIEMPALRVELDALSPDEDSGGDEYSELSEIGKDKPGVEPLVILKKTKKESKRSDSKSRKA